MYHTACKAQFQQLIQSVVLTAEEFRFLTILQLLFRLMQLERTWFYNEYCRRVYIAYSVVGTRDPEVGLTVIHI